MKHSILQRNSLRSGSKQLKGSRKALKVTRFTGFLPPPNTYLLRDTLREAGCLEEESPAKLDKRGSDQLTSLWRTLSSLQSHNCLRLCSILWDSILQSCWGRLLWPVLVPSLGGSRGFFTSPQEHGRSHHGPSFSSAPVRSLWKSVQKYQDHF